MAPHSSTLAWKIRWAEEPGRLQSTGSRRVRQDWAFHFHFHFSLSCFGEGNGNPLRCSCLENPRDREPGGLLSMGSQSRTRLKWLSSSSSSRHLATGFQIAQRTHEIFVIIPWGTYQLKQVYRLGNWVSERLGDSFKIKEMIIWELEVPTQDTFLAELGASPICSLTELPLLVPFLPWDSVKTEAVKCTWSGWLGRMALCLPSLRKHVRASWPQQGQLGSTQAD